MGMFGNRPPSPGCPPVVPDATPSLAPGSYDPCELCSVARAALYQLMSGSKPQRVAFHGKGGSGREVTYSAGSVKELRAEVRRLEQECELSRGQGRAVQAGPLPVPNGSGLGWGLPFNPFGPRRY